MSNSRPSIDRQHGNKYRPPYASIASVPLAHSAEVHANPSLAATSPSSAAPSASGTGKRSPQIRSHCADVALVALQWRLLLHPRSAARSAVAHLAPNIRPIVDHSRRRNTRQSRHRHAETDRAPRTAAEDSERPPRAPRVTSPTRERAAVLRPESALVRPERVRVSRWPPSPRWRRPTATTSLRHLWWIRGLERRFARDRAPPRASGRRPHRCCRSCCGRNAPMRNR